MSFKVCAICGLAPGEFVLETVRLGADEPSVKRVCNCTARQRAISFGLSGGFQEVNVRVGNHSIPDALNPPPCVKVDGLRLELEIRIDPRRTQYLRNSMAMTSEDKNVSERGCATIIKLEGREYNVTHRRRNRDTPEVKLQIYRVSLLPGVLLAKSAEVDYNLKVQPDYLEIVETNTFSLIQEADNVDRRLRVSKYISSGVTTSEIELPPARCYQTIIQTLVSTMRHGLLGSSWRVNISRRHVSDLRQSALPVLDIKSPPGPGHLYMLKADGEMTWIFEYGPVLVHTRSDPKLTVTGFSVIKGDDLPFDTANISVHRVETLASGQLIYIDTIMRNGTPSGITRPFELASAEFLDVRHFISRRVYDTYDEAIESSAGEDAIPHDGIVAVHAETSLTYRIKEPSVDMIVCEGLLCLLSEELASADDDKVQEVGYEAILSSASDMIEGTVYECFLKISNQRWKLTRYIVRTDKVKPNSVKLLLELDRHYMDLDLNASIVQREVSMASFEFRKHVSTRAVNTRKASNLIVDVGTGNGQALSILVNTGASYILCDPKLSLNLSRFPTIKAQDLTVLSVDDRVNWVRMAHKTRNVWGLFRGTLLDLLKGKVAGELVSKGVPFQCMFSISHIADDLTAMVRAGSPFIGCTYLYDQMDKDGVLIDRFGIKMWRKSRTHAFVTFPPFTKLVEFMWTRGLVHELQGRTFNSKDIGLEVTDEAVHGIVRHIHTIEFNTS